MTVVCDDLGQLNWGHKRHHFPVWTYIRLRDLHFTCINIDEWQISDSQTPAEVEQMREVAIDAPMISLAIFPQILSFDILLFFIFREKKGG